MDGSPTPARWPSARRSAARSRWRRSRGGIVYAADTPQTAPLQAYFLTSGIARGRILSMDTAGAEGLAGVVKVYTHRNAPERIATPYTQKGGYVSDTNMPLTGTEIRHDGQIVAMVVAETYEVARDASHRIVVRYEAAAPAATMDSPGVAITHPDALDEKEKTAGDFGAALAAAPVTVEGEYRTPAQHQNAIELYSTTASWSGGTLTIHEPSQFVVELANGAAAMMGVDPSIGPRRQPVHRRGVRRQGLHDAAHRAGRRRGARAGAAGAQRRDARPGLHAGDLPRRDEAP